MISQRSTSTRSAIIHYRGKNKKQKLKLQNRIDNSCQGKEKNKAATKTKAY
jgi:hypothetical protein